MKCALLSLFAAVVVILLVFGPHAHAVGKGVSVSIEAQQSLQARTTAGLFVNVDQSNVNVISPDFLCFESAYPEGFLDVHGNAHRGMAIIDTSLISLCLSPSGTPIPAILIITCTANGNESAKDVSNGKFRGVGGSGHSHTTSVRNSADCTVDVDGTVYDASGRMTESHTVKTIKQ